MFRCHVSFREGIGYIETIFILIAASPSAGVRGATVATQELLPVRGTQGLGLFLISNDPRDGRFPGDPHGRVGWGWGGVGDDNVLCTCTHGRCYATSWDGVGWGGVGWGMITFLALAHMVGATQHHLSCTCTHGRCYATSWDGVGWGGVGDDNVPCTCAHGRCYATSTFLYLHTWCLAWCLPQMLSKSLCGNSDSHAPRKKG